MYAVVQLGSTQFKVAEGDTIQADSMKEDVGKKITLDKVLAYAKDEDVRIGQPYLKDVKVEATIMKHAKGPKVVSLKYRKRKDSAVKKGKRALKTALNITKISA